MNLFRMSSSRRRRRGMVGLLAAGLLVATGAFGAPPTEPKPGAKKPARPVEKAHPATPRPGPSAPAADSAPAVTEPPATLPAVTPSAPVVQNPVPPPAPAKPPADDDLYEGPAKPKAAPVKPAKAGAPNGVSASLSPGPKYADAWPSEFRVAEADLALEPANEARAQAMAEFIRGNAAEEKGDADVALEAWKRAATLDPGDAKLAVDVASKLAKRNETAEAIRLLKDSIAASPKEPRTLIYLAQIYAKNLNKVELAVQTAQKAIEIAPDFFPAYQALYELVEDQTDKKKAGEIIERALKSTSKEPDFWLQLGNFLRTPYIDEVAKASVDDLGRMERAFLRAAELKPDDASVLTQTGDFFGMAGNQKRALDFYGRAVKLNQAPKDKVTENLRGKYIDALIENGRQAEAIPLLDELVRDPAAPMQQKLIARLGELYEQTNQPDKAIDLLKQSLVLDAGDPDNHLALANAQLRAKKPDDAVATMAAAVKKFSDRPEVEYLYAQFLSKAKRHADALATFTKVYESAKRRDSSLLTAAFYSEWGAAAERAGQMDLAAEKMKLAIEENPRSALLLNNLGFMWVDKGMNLEEAAGLIRQALEIEPRSGAYLDSLGWYYFKVGKFEDARRELLAALAAFEGDKNEEDPTVYDHLADTYDKLGNQREAISFWEKALKLNPEDADKIRAKVEAAKKKPAE